MSSQFLPRAISLVMAATITLTMLAGIDNLATTQHAAQDLMARAVMASPAV